MEMDVVDSDHDSPSRQQTPGASQSQTATAEAEAVAETTPSGSSMDGTQSGYGAGDFVEQVEVLMANPAAAQPSFAVQLHPLVIMNISDHWTRIKAQEGSSKQVLGVILGTQQGRNLEIENSFELATLEVEDQLVLDLDYLNAKEVRYKQVFPDLDVLGWYTTGAYPEPSPVDLHVHKQVLARSENPLLLKLVPMSAQHSDLPVTMYESLIDLKGSSSPRLLFLQTTYSIVTEEAERIGIDHVARMASTDAIGESSAAADPLLAQFGAIKMLHSRIKIILAFLAAMEGGAVPINYEILRDVSSLANNLPLLNTEQFKQELSEQCADVSLVAFLGVLTRAAQSVHQFVSKFNAVHDRGTSASRRMRGLLF